MTPAVEAYLNVALHMPLGGLRMTDANTAEVQKLWREYSTLWARLTPAEQAEAVRTITAARAREG